MLEEEKFFAWLDGELPADEAARVEAEVAADPRLSNMAREHRAMAAGLRRAFDDVAAHPVSGRFGHAVEGVESNVVDIAEARSARAGRRPAPLWAQMAALAATLAVGVFAGNLLSDGTTSPIVPENGRLVASADLENALYARLASAPADTGPRIGLTFRDKGGAVCRTFADRSASGLACREGGDWQIRALFQGEAGAASDYRMASSGDPRLMEAVDAVIVGEPFDADEERAAMKRGW